MTDDERYLIDIIERLALRLTPGPRHPDPFPFSLTVGQQGSPPPQPPGPGLMGQYNQEVIAGDGPIAFTLAPTHKGRPVKVDTIEVDLANPDLFDATVEGNVITFVDKGVAGETEATLSVDVDTSDGVTIKTLALGLRVVDPQADDLLGAFGTQGEESPTAPPSLMSKAPAKKKGTKKSTKTPE